MPYIVICKKADGSIEVAAHPGEAAPELLQDAQPASTVDEAVQMAQQVLSEGGAGDETAAHEGAESTGTERMEGASGMDPEDKGGAEMPADVKGMPMKTREDQMAAGYSRAKKGY